MFNLKSSIILTAIFVVTLIGMPFAQGKMMHDRKDGRNQILKRLSLTQEQKDQMSELKFKHRKEMIDMRAQLKKNLLDLKEVKSKDNFTRDEVINSVKKVNDSRDKIALAKANNMYDIYNLLTPDQKKIWKENQNKRDFFHQRGMRDQCMPFKRMPFQEQDN